MSGFWSRAEAKVKASTLSTLGVALALALLNAFVGNSELLGSLPGWLQFVVVTCAPTVAAFLAGYKARHTAIAPVSPGTAPAAGKHTAAKP